MTEKSTFEQGHPSSELDELSLFQQVREGEEVAFDSDVTPLGMEERVDDDDGIEEIGDDDIEEIGDDEIHHHGVLDHHHPSGVGGGVGLAVGALLVMAGVCLMLTISLVPSFAETLTGPLAKIGLTAMSLLLAGLVVFGFAFLVRRQHRLEHTIQTAHDQRGRLETGLEYLVQAQEHHLDRPPASGEELDRVLLCLQRQEEKINNLTKAIKMYGKPLIEISNQTSETGHELAEINGLVSKLSSQMEGLGGHPSKDELSELIQKSSQGLTGEDLRREFGSLEEKIDESTKRLAGGVDRLLEQDGKPSDSNLDSALQGIRQELANLATNLSAIQRGAAQAARSAPASSAPPPPAASGTGQGGSSTSGSSSGIGGLAHSISGAKKAPGKNVLGAIAKLRQMRN